MLLSRLFAVVEKTREKIFRPVLFNYYKITPYSVLLSII